MRTVPASIAITIALIWPTAARSDGLPPQPVPLELYGTELPTDRCLPKQATDPSADAPSASGSRAYLLAPEVQAIPTPTAFGAGVVVLCIAAALRVARRVRRWRSAG